MHVNNIWKTMDTSVQRNFYFFQINSQSAPGVLFFLLFFFFKSLCFKNPKWNHNCGAAFQIKRTAQSSQDMAPSQLFNACRSIYNQLGCCCLIDKPHIRQGKVNNCAFFHLKSSVESLGPQPLFILSFTNIYCELPPGTTD